MKYPPPAMETPIVPVTSHVCVPTRSTAGDGRTVVLAPTGGGSTPNVDGMVTLPTSPQYRRGWTLNTTKPVKSNVKTAAAVIQCHNLTASGCRSITIFALPACTDKN